VRRWYYDYLVRHRFDSGHLHKLLGLKPTNNKTDCVMVNQKFLSDEFGCSSAYKAGYSNKFLKIFGSLKKLSYIYKTTERNLRNFFKRL